MKNLFILPTDKPSRLHSYCNNLKYLSLSKTPLYWKEALNIYITSDEEIKKGEYRLHVPSETISKWDGEGSLRTKDYKKIILTTDSDLIKEGVQAIDDEFLEWFVKNPSCESIEVIKDRVFRLDEFNQREFYNQYKIIIPKEVDWSDLENSGLDKSFQLIEEPKQETLEEVAERLCQYVSENPPYTIIKPKSKIEGFIEGYKLAQEQNKKLYSEEEARGIWKAGQEYFKTSGNSITFEELTEQLKKQ